MTFKTVSFCAQFLSQLLRLSWEIKSCCLARPLCFYCSNPCGGGSIFLPLLQITIRPYCHEVSVKADFISLVPFLIWLHGSVAAAHTVFVWVHVNVHNAFLCTEHSEVSEIRSALCLQNKKRRFRADTLKRKLESFEVGFCGIIIDNMLPIVETSLNKL